MSDNNETKDLNVKKVPRADFERWQEAARSEGRSLSNWLQLTLSAAADRVLTMHRQASHDARASGED